MSSYTRIMSGMRDLFQAMGLENMVKDELEISSFGRRSIRAGGALSTYKLLYET